MSIPADSGRPTPERSDVGSGQTDTLDADDIRVACSPNNTTNDVNSRRQAAVTRSIPLNAAGQKARPHTGRVEQSLVCLTHFVCTTLSGCEVTVDLNLVAKVVAGHGVELVQRQRGIFVRDLFGG